MVLGKGQRGLVMMADSDLLKRLKEGEKAALEQLYDKYAALLFKAALRTVQHPFIAEVVLEELFANIWSTKGQHFYSNRKLSVQLLLLTNHYSATEMHKRNRQLKAVR